MSRLLDRLLHGSHRLRGISAPRPNGDARRPALGVGDGEGLAQTPVGTGDEDGFALVVGLRSW